MFVFVFCCVIIVIYVWLDLSVLTPSLCSRWLLFCLCPSVLYFMISRFSTFCLSWPRVLPEPQINPFLSPLCALGSSLPLPVFPPTISLTQSSLEIDSGADPLKALLSKTVLTLQLAGLHRLRHCETNHRSFVRLLRNVHVYDWANYIIGVTAMFLVFVPSQLDRRSVGLLIVWIWIL